MCASGHFDLFLLDSACVVKRSRFTSYSRHIDEQGCEYLCHHGEDSYCLGIVCGELIYGPLFTVKVFDVLMNCVRSFFLRFTISSSSSI